MAKRDRVRVCDLGTREMVDLYAIPTENICGYEVVVGRCVQLSRVVMHYRQADVLWQKEFFADDEATFDEMSRFACRAFHLFSDGAHGEA